MWLVLCLLVVAACAEPGAQQQDTLSSAWVNAHSVAQFFNLSKTGKVHVPIQINVVLVGFQGDGHQQLDVPQEHLAHFFEHIAHRLEHVVVPLGEEQTTLKQVRTRETHIEYDVTLRFVMADPLVTVALENLLLQNARDDDEPNTMYVDVFRVTSLFHHLLDHLHLANSSYTLLLLNPKPPVAGKRYGYRAGLAGWELNELRKDRGWQDKLDIFLRSRKVHNEPLVTLAPQQGHLAHDGVGKAWAEWYLRHAAEGAEDCKSIADDESLTAPSCLAMWKVAGLSLHGLTRHMARQGARYHVRYLQAVLRGEVPEDCLVDAWVSHERFAFLDVSAGPFEWSPLGSAAVGVRNLMTVPRHSFGGGQGHPTPSAEESAFETLKLTYQVLCLSDDAPNATECSDLLDQLHKFDHEKHKMELPLDATASDAWLADLSALSARAVQHLFVPGVPLFASPFAKRVHISVFVLSTHTDYDPRGPEYFNFDEFRSELLRLAAPGQEVDISIRELSPAAQRSVALAFHESLHNAMIPSVDVDSGAFKPLRHVYVDSKLLRSKLQNLPRPAPAGAVLLNERHISVFLFSTSYPYPVMVDRYFQAKALGDVVVVTQSNFPAHPSKIQCNGRAVMLDLRDPAREALAATALHMGGLLPHHLSYSRATHCVQQEWLWSVGDSPLSHTSHGLHFGVLHSDLVARNYLLAALEHSLNVTDGVVETLQWARTMRENFSVVRNVSSAVQSLGQVWELWETILARMSRLQWKEALQLLPPLDGNVTHLQAAVKSALAEMESFKCAAAASRALAQQSGTSWRSVLIGAAVLDVLAVAAYAVYMTRKKQKVKIN
jgi:hypothetical protein